ncbi:MAG: DMT family transporter, partial [Pseudomonadota bacterium]
LFKRRHFAVGTVLKKTETLQAVFVGFVILGDTVSLFAFGAMIVGLVGVLLLSDQAEKMSWRGFFTPSAGLGLFSGLLFAFAGIGYRGAGLSIEGDDVFLRATITLAASLFIQVALLRFYVGIWEPSEILKVVQTWRTGIWVGIFSILASLCWFNAFILQNVALVNAVGQVEVIFSLAASYFIFSERITKREYLGCGLIVASVLLLVLM